MNAPCFKTRRCQLMSAVEADTLIFILSAPECVRNQDVNYPYRPNSDFHYLTAFPEPDSLAILCSQAGGEQGKFILFSRPKNEIDSLWIGEAIGVKGACDQYDADFAYPLEQLEGQLALLSAHRRAYYFLGASNPALRQRIERYLQTQPHLLYNETANQRLTNIVHEMRLQKTAEERQAIQQAVTVSTQAHQRAMQACRPGLYEYHLEAELLYTFCQQGCRETAYPSIVASGANACILHYTANKAELKAGDLVLIDAGCEYQYYASDITRCFPVTGRFSPEQKAIYEIVLQAQQAVITQIKPGVAWNTLQALCARVITEGLKEVGLLKGSLETLLEQKAYRKFYMHGFGHWLGLDVHDVGSYQVDGQARCLELNQIFTVEPGIYIRQQADVDPKWWNIGIRIEDNVCVTATEPGVEVLSKALPKEIDTIETWMCG
ncbi:aminopeptidase P N-terminal domain-containing protein [Rickettsiella massiliensis]|uniref:aminopeptidase P N-terminal domain-containing protein n=1 Tax=Rickettsiella massiliensis TaxID=676517 RepID=UPI0004975851|nr:aminopeptidase P N-terminal domain-containing protein [Rickettsiella massiliensis]